MTEHEVPVTPAELERLAAQLSLARLDLANLVAAARAALAADREGESDPLGYLRDEIAEHQERR